MSDYLLRAVDELTLPQRFKHLVERRDKTTGRLVTEHGHPVIDVVKVELPPLLVQLEAAVRGSMGSKAGSAGLARERNVLDSDALFQAAKIRSVIDGWCRIVHVHPTGNLAARLRAWYTGTLAQGVADAQETFYVGQMRSWVGFIRGHLEPAHEMDLPFACPVCGADTWWDAGKEFRRPLVVRYLPEGPDMVSRARGVCRACERVWSVRELAWAIEHPNEDEEPEGESA